MNQTNRRGDTDRHWQLGAEGARRVLGRGNQTGRTQPLSQLSSEGAEQVLRSLSTAAAPRGPRKEAPAVGGLPSVMVDPELLVPVPQMTSSAAGWMFAPEKGGTPLIVDDEELRAATARPIGGFIRWMGRLFRS